MRFHYVKETDLFAHAFGDVVLRLVAECIREEDPVLCGRFGGDEFLIYLSETGDAFAAKTESLIRRFKEKIQYPVEGVRFSISAGAASVPDDAKDYDTLFQKADCALYAAKHAGKNCWVSYSEEMNH